MVSFATECDPNVSSGGRFYPPFHVTEHRHRQQRLDLLKMVDAKFLGYRLQRAADELRHLLSSAAPLYP